MKTYTDEELQAAIDAAILLFGRESGMSWQQLAPNRLAIAKAFLEKLQPDPYAELKKAHAQGKVIQYQSANGSWNDLEDFDFCTLAENYRIKPDEHSTFEAHGKTWTSHTPGDPMPNFHGKTVLALDKSGSTWSTQMDVEQAIYWEDADYSNPFIGWRYADEPMSTKPNSLTPWTPAVGDVVQLKSGGPKMTVALLKETLCKCQWFRGDEADLETFEIATLQPVTE